MKTVPNRVSWLLASLLGTGLVVAPGVAAIDYGKYARGSVAIGFGSTEYGDDPAFRGSGKRQIICKQEAHSRPQKQCVARLFISAPSKLATSSIDPSTSSIDMIGDDDRDLGGLIVADTSNVKAEFKRNQMDFDGVSSTSYQYDMVFRLTFTCDYSRGEYLLSGTAKFRSPQFLVGVKAGFVMKCLPLTGGEADAQRSAENAAMRKAADEKAEAQRRTTPAYKMQDAANQIRLAQGYISAAQKAIANERQIGAVSGYVDKARMHEAGAQIVFYQRLQAVHWEIYKRNGGQARSIAELLQAKRR